MDFIMFLGVKEKEILELLYKAKFKVEENTPLCLIGENYFGFFKREQKTIVICTNNAMKRGGYHLPRSSREDYFDKTGIYIRRALRHESVHVAQKCNGGSIKEAFNVEKIKIHPFKNEALIGSTSISGRKDRELEAYWLEDKPKKVIYILKKYCF
tara:strand:- start:292 stop:756 length:465 start_codon:yes stop_codon:yes gene_type:complete